MHLLVIPKHRTKCTVRKLTFKKYSVFCFLVFGSLSIYLVILYAVFDSSHVMLILR
jgi:hypothetical protein